VALLSLDDIFTGYAERSRTALEESIICCQAWKETYTHLSMVHNKHGTEEWVLDESSIFAHVDAFIQRCKDLLEVVEGQVRGGGRREGGGGGGGGGRIEGGVGGFGIV